MSDSELTELTEPELLDSDSEEVEDSGPVAKRVRGTGKSGWCLEFHPGGHERCPITVGSFTCTCTCDNHGVHAGEQQKSPPSDEDDLTTV